MPLLNKNKILAKNTRLHSDVEVPEWGGTVRVSEMSAFERDQFDLMSVGKNGGSNSKNFRARLVAFTATDEKGERLFNEKDTTKLGKKSNLVIGRLFDAAWELNELDVAEVDKQAKNS